LKKHWQYLCYVLRHKWFVFIECCRLGIPWLGIIHDLSKFLPSEWFPYVEKFYGNKSIPCVGRDFDYAWLAHQRSNKHHWQAWISIGDKDGVDILEMPDRYRKEMLADWIGAGKAQGKPDTRAWYEKNKDRIYLGVTKKWVEDQLYR
jgi:hypothetical protein